MVIVLEKGIPQQEKDGLKGKLFKLIISFNVILFENATYWVVRNYSHIREKRGFTKK